MHGSRILYRGRPCSCHPLFFSFFFFNDTATTEIYTLSLHDALPILRSVEIPSSPERCPSCASQLEMSRLSRSEEHTSELQSLAYLVCRLLLEKKKKNTHTMTSEQNTLQCTRHTACIGHCIVAHK